MGLHQKLADGFHAVGQANIKQMTNYKTTILGIVTILAAVSVAAKEFLTNGSLPDIGILFASVAAGWGLIAARDAKD